MRRSGAMVQLGFMDDERFKGIVMTDFTTYSDPNTHAMADVDVCIAVGEDLTSTFPGHPWMVGADHEAGTVVIRLGYNPPLERPRLAEMGYLLHLSTVLGPGGQKKYAMPVRKCWSGGDCLAKWQRSKAGIKRQRMDWTLTMPFLKAGSNGTN